jgi:hypothetical protein
VDSTELSPNPEREKDNYVYLDLPMLRDVKIKSKNKDNSDDRFQTAAACLDPS